MAIYLHVRTGSLQLLLDGLGVHEVLSLEDLPEGAQGHMEWREMVLQAVPVHQFFGQTSGDCRMAVVYSATEGEQPMVLQVEEVMGLLNITPAQWLAMPRLPEACAVFFDGLIADANTSAQVYRLRRPLASELFKPTAAD